MKKRHRNIFATLLLSTALMLGACNDGDTLADTDIESYPENVQNGDVSVEYYEQIDEFYNEQTIFISKLSEMVNLELEDKSIVDSKQYKQDLSSLLNDSNKFLGNLKAKPKTEADEKIDFQFQKLVYLQMEFNNLKLQQIKDKNSDLEEDLQFTSNILENISKDLDEVLIHYQILEHFN